MRIGLIADVHGNLPALDAVLADIKQAGVDRTVFLGDAVYFGPQPHECVQRLADLGCACVMGNADEVIIEVVDSSNGKQPSVESAWAAAQLTAADLAFMRTFQPSVGVDLGEGRSLLCFHGSPESNRARLPPGSSADEVDAHIGEQRAAVMAGGHTHLSMVRPHRGMLIVNVGSVGMPFERPRTKARDFLLPWAEYGVVTAEGGMLSVELRHVDYNIEAVKAAAQASGKPALHHWLDDWVR